jgi:hypothetical protein
MFKRGNTAIVKYVNESLLKNVQFKIEVVEIKNHKQEYRENTIDNFKFNGDPYIYLNILMLKVFSSRIVH